MMPAVEVPPSEEVVQTIRLWIDAAENMTGVPSNILKATIVLAFGWLLAFVARGLVGRFIRNVSRLMAVRGNAERVSITMSQHRIDLVVGRFAFWIVLIFTVMTATQELGLPVVSSWLIVVAGYLPRVFLSALIIFIGVIAGALCRSALARALPASDIVDPQGFGGLVQGVVVGFSILIAVQQLGIDVGFIMTIVTIALIGFFAAGALAFGFGGRATVANILASHYVRELYEVGQTIRIRELEGRIVRMTPTAVILSTEEGETAVPSQLFVEASSTRVADGGRL
jgi:Mechanosensitive ion channel